MGAVMDDIRCLLPLVRMPGRPRCGVNYFFFPVDRTGRRTQLTVLSRLRRTLVVRRRRSANLLSANVDDFNTHVRARTRRTPARIRPPCGGAVPFGRPAVGGAAVPVRPKQTAAAERGQRDADGGQHRPFAIVSGQRGNQQRRQRGPVFVPPRGPAAGPGGRAAAPMLRTAARKLFVPRWVLCAPALGGNDLLRTLDLLDVVGGDGVSDRRFRVIDTHETFIENGWTVVASTTEDGVVYSVVTARNRGSILCARRPPGWSWSPNGRALLRDVGIVRDGVPGSDRSANPCPRHPQPAATRRPGFLLHWVVWIQNKVYSRCPPGSKRTVARTRSSVFWMPERTR